MKRVMLATSETSMAQPRPVLRLRNSAASTAKAASCPASMSAAGAPTFCGPFSTSPVRSMTLE